MQCPTYTPFGATAPLVCLRQHSLAERHLGRHHAYEEMLGWKRLWTWSEGGASGLSRESSERAKPCIKCYTPHDRSTNAICPHTQMTVCFHCEFWDARLEAYNDPTFTKPVFIRPHGDHGPFDERPNLYNWSEGHHGGFGQRSYKIVMDDGREFGPNDYLWSSGAIPWWLEDKFVPNCVIMPALQTYIKSLFPNFN